LSEINNLFGGGYEERFSAKKTVDIRRLNIMHSIDGDFQAVEECRYTSHGIFSWPKSMGWLYSGLICFHRVQFHRRNANQITNKIVQKKEIVNGMLKTLQ
jgi:hypothetical protein